MRNNLVDSEVSASGALAGLLSQDGGRLPMLRVFHEAAADVEKSLKFWKKIVRKIPSQHRVSREFFDRQS